MALNQRTVNLEYRGGIDRKTDQRLVIPTKLAVADNVEFLDADTVVRRAGLSQRGLLGSMGPPVRMFEHGGVPTVEFDDGRTYRASDTVSGGAVYGASKLVSEVHNFMRVGALVTRKQSLVRKNSVVGTPVNDLNFDMAVADATYFMAWEGPNTFTGRVTVYWSLRNLDDDAEILSGNFSTTGSDIHVKPRVVYNYSTKEFVLFFSHFLSGATSFAVDALAYADDGSSFSSSPGLVTTAAGGAVEGALGLEALFDASVLPGDGYAVCARFTDATGTLRMVLLDETFAPVTAGNRTCAVRPVSLTTHYTKTLGTVTGHVFYGAGAILKGAYLPQAGVFSAENSINTVVGSLVGRVAVQDTGGNFLIVADTFTATSSVSATSYLFSASPTHAFNSRTPISTNCFIAGRIFSMRSRYIIPVLFTSQQYQSVVLLLDVTAAVDNLSFPAPPQACVPTFVARLDWGECANPSSLAADSAHRVPSCNDLDNRFMIPFLKYETNTRLAGVTNSTPVSIAMATLDTYGQLADAKWNGDTYLAGALPLICDGQDIVEEGFHWAPEIVGTVINGLVVIPPVATGAGFYDFPAVGTYTVAFTESWQDAQGNWHESGVALLGTVTTTLGNLAINPLVIRPPSSKPNSKLTMYRTLASSTNTTLYLAHSSDLGSGGGYVPDTMLASGEPLYTEGGVLSNTPAPACRHITPFQDRLVISGCADGFKVLWSKAKAQGFAAEFVSDDVAFQQIAPPEFGKTVSCIEMMSKLVVLGEKRIGIIYGTGPDPTGAQLGYAPLESAVADMGAAWSSPKSAILASEGVWFQSVGGIRLFDGGSVVRDSSGKWVGSDVDEYANGSSFTVVAARGVDTQQTRFAVPGTNYMLVWSQHWRQFTRFTNHSCVDVVVAGSKYYLLSDTILRFPDNGLFATERNAIGAVVPFESYIESAWFQFGGVQGFQRIYRGVVLGSAGVAAPTGNQTIRVLVAYDYVEGLVQEATGVVVAKAGGTIQFEHQFFRQKCESMKLGIAFSPTGASRLRLTDLALLVGVKKGPYREPATF